MQPIYFFLKNIGTVEGVITKDLCEQLQKEHNADAIWAYTIDCKEWHICACYKENRQDTSGVPATFYLNNPETADAYRAEDIDPEEEDVFYLNGVLYKLSTEFITDEEYEECD